MLGSGSPQIRPSDADSRLHFGSIGSTSRPLWYIFFPMQATALTDEIARHVEASQVIFEETRGCLTQQDAFFGTTIKPERLLGCPVWLQCGAMYAVVVVQRFSIEPYSKIELQMVECIAQRIGLLASRHPS